MDDFIKKHLQDKIINASFLLHISSAQLQTIEFICYSSFKE